MKITPDKETLTFFAEEGAEHWFHSIDRDPGESLSKTAIGFFDADKNEQGWDTNDLDEEIYCSAFSNHVKEYLQHFVSERKRIEHLLSKAILP
jgi:hypothetical protein